MTTINAKTLRANLPAVVERVRKGARYAVLYRSRPAFRIVPVEGDEPVTDRHFRQAGFQVVPGPARRP